MSPIPREFAKIRAARDPLAVLRSGNWTGAKSIGMYEGVQKMVRRTTFALDRLTVGRQKRALQDDQSKDAGVAIPQKYVIGNFSNGLPSMHGIFGERGATRMAGPLAPHPGRGL
jgi:hypothetical protein